MLQANLGNIADLFDNSDDDDDDDDDEDGNRDILEGDDDDEAATTGYKACGCLPACSSITYDAEISQTPVDFVQRFKANNVYDDEDDEWERLKIISNFS